MANDVPRPIYEKLRRLQSLSNSEWDAYGANIDWKRAYDSIVSDVRTIFFRSIVDVDAEERRFSAVGLSQSNAARCLGHDHAAEDTAIDRNAVVSLVLSFDCTIGIQDGDQQSLGRLVLQCR